MQHIMNLMGLALPFLGETNLNDESWNWVMKIVDALNTPLLALLILVSAAGMIYAVVLGVKMARADGAEKREEAKKSLTNVLVAFAVTIGLVALFYASCQWIIPALFEQYVGDTSPLNPTSLLPYLRMY